MHRVPRPNLAQRLIARWRRHALLKVVGTSFWVSAFFVGYFHILRSTAHEAVVMPLTALDRLIDFQPTTLFVYLSLWFYVGIPPALFYGLRELLTYGWWAAGLCVTGLACFYFWPTAVPPSPVTTTDFPGFELIQGIDALGNACPSMHVATAAFSAFWLHRLLRELDAGRGVLALNWCWFILIAYSTLATKQHVVLDVLAGLALGTAFAVLSMRNRPRPASPSFSCQLH
jgi:membrane-associated phospholipid phosphatase